MLNAVGVAVPAGASDADAGVKLLAAPLKLILARFPKIQLLAAFWERQPQKSSGKPSTTVFLVSALSLGISLRGDFSSFGCGLGIGVPSLDGRVPATGLPFRSSTSIRLTRPWSGGRVVTRIIIPAFRSAARKAFSSSVILASSISRKECSLPPLLVIMSV